MNKQNNLKEKKTKSTKTKRKKQNIINARSMAEERIATHF